MIKSNVSETLVVEEQGLLCWSEVFVGVLQYFHAVGSRRVKLGGIKESFIYSQSGPAVATGACATLIRTDWRSYLVGELAVFRNVGRFEVW